MQLYWMVKYLVFHIGTPQFQSQINSLLIKSISQGNNNKDDFLSYANDYENLAAAWIF